LTTDKHGRGNRQQLDLSATVHWENTSGETVPAFGVVQLRSNFSSTSKASKPNTGTGLFFVNGPVTVEASAFGESLVWNKPRKVLLDGSPEVGDEVGPVEDQWYMSTDGTGWRVLHQAVGGVGVVVKDGGAGTTSEIRAGIVRGRVDAQFYEVELGNLPRSAFANHDVECISCDPCLESYGTGTSECGLAISDPESIVVGGGETVTAYDPFSDKIPLKDGTDCVVAKLVGVGAAYGDYGGYGNGDAWVVLNGYHEHIVEYKERWDCCEPDGPPVLVAKTPIILIGVACDEIACGACPEGE
jgi:hypothetical protein